MKGALVFSLLWLSFATVSAQEYRGAFSGNITDQQGAPVAKVKVLAIETRTGAKSETLSESSGEFTIPFLAPGEYQLVVELPGFKRYVRNGLILSSGQHPVLDVRLEVGEATQSVTVDAAVPLIESANDAVGQVITQDEMEDFPVNGRSPIMLATLALGVVSTSQPGPVRPFDTGATGNFSFGGAPPNSNEFLLDGAPNSGYSLHMAYPPPQDAVQELRIHVFESDAAYGHSGGGTANLITKSGTNSFHGSIYDFNQVSKLNANSFFLNKNAVGRPVTTYNQYGITAGGPVLIPKVFNGKNRIFWFFAFEGLRDADPASSPSEGGLSVTTVPTSAERKGDFSALLNLNNGGTSYAIYDPATGVASGAQVGRTPFANNIIPSSRLNPIALNYLQFYPAANIPGQANGQNNYGIGITDQDSFANELGRLDLNLSDKNKLSFDVRHSYRAQNKNIYFSNNAYGVYYDNGNEGSTLDDVYTISPTTVMDIRANWTRFKVFTSSPATGYDPTKLGFPSYIAGNSEFLGMPYMQFGTCGTSFQCLGDTSDSLEPYDSYQLFGDVVKFRGNQTLKLGVDVRVIRQSYYSPGASSGAYSFGSNWTNGPLSNAAASPLGQDFAAFLLGLPSSGSYSLNTHGSEQAKYFAGFVQDDWRVKTNLTLNIGVRWEHETPAVERYNRSVNGFDPAAVNPIASAAAAAYAKNPIMQVPVSQFSALGGLTFASSGQRNIYQTNSSIVSPRVGFAWTPKALGARTVLRGGFGVFVTPTGLAGGLNLNQEGFSQTTQFVATNNNYLSPASTLSNPFPNGFVQPAGSTQGPGTFLGQQITYYNEQVRSSYCIRWNFDIQRELPGQVVLEVAYVGNHGVHLPVASTQLDSIPGQYLATGQVRNNPIISALTGSVSNPFQGLLPNATSLNGPTVPLGQLLTPFPQYPLGSGTSNGIIAQNNGAGSSYYESLNVRLQKRFTHGLTLINNFIWNSLIERVIYLNDSDPAPEKRISATSVPLRDALGLTYELPVGRNKHFALRSRVADAVLGGWSTNAMLTIQSGLPLSWGNVIYDGGALDLNSHQPNSPAFNVAQFNTVSSQQLANNIRTFDTQFNNLRVDPTRNLDLSMTKELRFGEHRYVQLRFESFNITNRVTFSAPNTTPTSSAFGLITNQANTPRRIQMGARIVW